MPKVKNQHTFLAIKPIASEARQSDLKGRCEGEACGNLSTKEEFMEPVPSPKKTDEKS